MIGNKIGKLGEDLAVMFLKKHNFTILETNVLVGGGEIDLIVEKKGVTHFIEVKAVSCEITSKSKENYNPLQNIDRNKLKILSRAVSVYVSIKNIKNWQFDVLSVEIDHKLKKVKIDFLDNQILC